MYQTHSNKVSVITKKNLGKKRFDSDAMITTLKGIGIGVLTADCVPILLYESKKKLLDVFMLDGEVLFGNYRKYYKKI